jgi:hypothetical protein
MLRDFIFKIVIKRRFKSHKNSLPKKSNIIDPKMEYDALKGAVYWEDEGLMERGPDLANAFGPVICFRTHLITYPENEIEYEDFNKFDKQIFILAKKYFPDWIGFHEVRCSYNAELSDRIKRIRKVSKWKIDKIMSEDIQSG